MRPVLTVNCSPSLDRRAGFFQAGGRIQRVAQKPDFTMSVMEPIATRRGDPLKQRQPGFFTSLRRDDLPSHPITHRSQARSVLMPEHA